MTTIRSSAPIRICDTGGWTDTWFAGSGVVFSIAVEPRVEVRIDVTETGGDTTFELPVADSLLEATVHSAALPSGVHLGIDIRSGVPAGAATGTSAAVVVALLAALDRLTSGVADPMTLARAAHRVETELLGEESGVQDQLAAAFGGINRFDVAYPEATVHPITPPPGLEERLVLVLLRRPHRSSEVHREVIAGGIDPAVLDRLRDAARRSAAACVAGDLDALGRAMVDNHEAQRALHPALVSVEADAVVDAARRHGAIGWKVNGAGGDGGSLTLLAGDGARGLGDVIDGIVPIRLAAKGVEASVSKSVR